MLEPEKDNVLNDAERHQVNDALEAVLATEKFEAAPQMSAFLRYVVEQAADGNQSRIKAFTVAVDALGKSDSFDPQNDPVVRVLAGRLRAALAAYNEEHQDAPVIITMTPGSYVPSFIRQTATQQPCAEAASSQSISGEAALQLDSEKESPVGMMSDVAASESETSVSDTEEALSRNAPREFSTVTARNINDATRACSLVSASATASAAQEVSASPPPGLLPDPRVLSGWFKGRYNPFTVVPKATLSLALIAFAIVGVVSTGIVQNLRNTDNSPDILAAEPVVNTVIADPAIRPRPDTPAVFISAINQGNALENSLNMVVSSVLSESKQVQVFRILKTEKDVRFWPEDYILTLTALDLPAEKQVNMQLMEADTGRVIHSRAVSLKEHADDQLTQIELTQITDAAQEIVRDSGPLLEHYNSRQEVQ